MLKIRARQFGIFSKSAIIDFEERMKLHLKKFFPEHCAALGDEDLVEMIRYGIESAEKYQIEIERDVCIYIDLMFTLGQEFDTDPELPWVAEILGSEDIPSPTARIDALYEETQRQLQAAGSTDGRR